MQQSHETQRKRQKQGPPPDPSKMRARRQLAAVSTARRYHLAVKQTKMATARRHKTEQPLIFEKSSTDSTETIIMAPQEQKNKSMYHKYQQKQRVN